jgi:hypothetical protein
LAASPLKNATYLVARSCALISDAGDSRLGVDGLVVVATLVDEAKQSGAVQKVIDAKGLKGVNVATK